jgi:hypothetical protein
MPSSNSLAAKLRDQFAEPPEARRIAVNIAKLPELAYSLSQLRVLRDGRNPATIGSFRLVRGSRGSALSRDGNALQSKALD